MNVASVGGPAPPAVIAMALTSVAFSPVGTRVLSGTGGGQHTPIMGRDDRPALTHVAGDTFSPDGRYNVARLVDRLGPDAKLTDWWPGSPPIPERCSVDMSDRCGVEPWICRAI